MKVTELLKESDDSTLKVGPPFPKEQIDAVKDMQRKLDALGYPVGVTGIDGKYGIRTSRAVRAFKRDFIGHGSGYEMSPEEIELLSTAKPKPKPSWTANARAIQGSSAVDKAEPTMGLLDMIKSFESFQARPYWDHKQWSVGYGSYAGSRDRGNPPDIEVSEQEAEAMLKDQLQKYIEDVEYWNRVGNYNWNTGQKEALVSFAYNIGSIKQLTAKGKRDNRTILKKMPLYNKASGKEIRGLTKRRNIEATKFKMHTPGLSRGV